MKKLLLAWRRLEHGEPGGRRGRLELCEAQGGDLEKRVSELEAAVLELQIPKIDGFTYVETNKTTGLHEYTHDQTGIEFVLLPGGVSNMGSPDDEPRRFDDEGPVHPVSLSPFLCAKYEVTQAEWLAVMGSNPSSFTGDDSRPVETVSWDDIQEFERRTGLVLPTEAQWEYACRAGQGGPYSGTGNLDDMGWYLSNGGNTTHPVGQKAPNQFGLHDMHGKSGSGARMCTIAPSIRRSSSMAQRPAIQRLIPCR